MKVNSKPALALSGVPQLSLTPAVAIRARHFPFGSAPPLGRFPNVKIAERVAAIQLICTSPGGIVVPGYERFSRTKSSGPMLGETFLLNVNCTDSGLVRY